MKKIALFILSLLFLLSVYSQKEIYNDFEAFWKVFKTAIIKNDKQKISILSKYGETGVNLPNKTIQIYDKEEFVKLYNKIITQKIKKLIITQTPVKWSANEIYGIKFSGEKQILFAKNDIEGWQFVGFYEYY